MSLIVKIQFSYTWIHKMLRNLRGKYSNYRQLAVYDNYLNKQTKKSKSNSSPVSKIK